MSIQDETWDRPICNFCGTEIHYGEKTCHVNGECLNIWKSFLENKTIMKKTITSTTQFQSNCDVAAEDILELFEILGFVSETPVDSNVLKNRVSEIILKNQSGNTSFNYES